MIWGPMLAGSNAPEIELDGLNLPSCTLEYANSQRDSSELDSFIRSTMADYHIPGVATWCFKK
jgi:hypothetical protein